MTNPTGGPSFFGIVATNGTTIGQVSLFGDSGISTDLDFAGVDRIVFAAPPSPVVPEPTGLVLAGVSAVGLALRSLRSRRKAA